MSGAGPDRAVILAGGGGTRLWPWTGPELPKPLLPLGGSGRTLLAAALDRLAVSVSPAAIHVQAPGALGTVLAHNEPRLSGTALWDEPSARDTGPAVALAMARAAAGDPDAVVAIAPADQRVEDVAAFDRALVAAAAAARAGHLVVLGVTPDHPSTRFGYVAPGEALPGGVPARAVERFIEKPDAARAVDLVARGCLWNAGLFVWSARTFREALARHAPAIAAAVDRFVASGDAADWDAATKQSIDYALMERAERVAVVPLDAGWDDVGGWEAVLRLEARGEAPGVTRLPLLGGRDDGSAVLSVGGALVPPAGLVGGVPTLVVAGPHGVLVAPRGEEDRVKSLLA